MSVEHIEMRDFFDRHGFKFLQLGSSHSADALCQCIGNVSSPDRNGNDWRMEMWQEVLEEWDTNHTELGVKLQTLMKQGVPASIRSQLWKKLLDVDTLKASKIFNYKAQLAAVREQLVDLGLSEYGGSEMLSHLADLEKSGYDTDVEGHISSDCLRHIILDLERSFPSNKKFLAGTGEGKEGRASLFRILATYARYNPKVGYCQGMSYIGGMLLMQLEENDAFWCFVSLMERQKYLRGYYSANMSRIQRHGAVFGHLLKRRHPRLHAHLEQLGAQPLLYMTPWFLCLFTSLPCWDTVLAVWDLLLLDGVKAIFRVALTMIDQLEDTLLNTKDFSNIMPKLLHPDCERVCVVKFMPVVWTVGVDEKELSELETMQLNQDRRTSNKRDRRSMLDSPCVVEKVIKNKRQKTATDAAPSLFRKFVNMFTPKEQRIRLEEAEEENGRSEPAKVPKARRRLSNQKSSGSLSKSRRSVGTPRNGAENMSGMSTVPPCQDIKDENLKFTDETDAFHPRPQIKPLHVHNSPVLPSSSKQKRRHAHVCHRRQASGIHSCVEGSEHRKIPPNGAIIPHMGHV